MQSQNLLLTNRNLQDLNPLTAGEQVCPSGHSFGPAVRNYTLIHYVVKGKGTFYARGGVYPVEAGQAFLILPGEVTTYKADLQDPWHYRWIGFDGSLSQQFAQLPPVFSLEEEVFGSILRFGEDPTVAEYQLASRLLRLYARLFARSGGNPHVRRVENYIRSCYMDPIRVEQIAAMLNLDRRYLSRLFKEKTGLSMQQYLIRIRLEEAAGHLQRGAEVQEAACLVGYSDVSNFSKMFKKYYGKSPARYSQQLK